MQPTRVIANLSVPDIDKARSFYADYLGLSVQELDMDLGCPLPVS